MNSCVSGRFSPVVPVALVEVGQCVEPETVEPEVEPEPDDVEHRLAHFGVVVVEVRLVGVEAVPVVLVADRVVGPVGALDVDEDHPRLGPALVVLVPYVPVGLRVVATLARFDEPGMQVARMVDDQVGDDPDTPRVRLVEQRAQVVDRPGLGVHRVEVADVVAAVHERRGIEREEPEAVDAQPLEVVELRDEPGDVADPVAVPVEEAADEDLVEDRPLEPERVLLGRGQLLGDGRRDPPRGRSPRARRSVSSGSSVSGPRPLGSHATRAASARRAA